MQSENSLPPRKGLSRTKNPRRPLLSEKARPYWDTPFTEAVRMLFALWQRRHTDKWGWIWAGVVMHLATHDEELREEAAKRSNRAWLRRQLDGLVKEGV